MKKWLIVIAGPTAVGKTELTVRLSQELAAPVISADSRQLYQEMTIGTAKPTEDELRKAPHYFINSHSIMDDYTVADYEKEVIALLNRLYQRTDSVILSGGSGLYINSVLSGLDDIPDVEPEIRVAVQHEFEKRGLANLLDELKLVDPEYYDQVDKANPRRVMRAVEIVRQTKRPFSSFRKSERKVRDFTSIVIGLDRERPELYERINIRVDTMMQAGLLEEVKRLYSYRHMPAMQTVGYSEIIGYLEGKHDLDEAVRLIKRNTRHYAKRQLTWFKNKMEIKWFHPDNMNEIMTYCKANILF